MTLAAAPGSDADAALAPLRAALLAHARQEAEQLRSRAAGDAAAIVGTARSEDDVLLAEARQQGEADARVLLRVERNRLERDNRRRVLQAQREAYVALTLASAVAVRELLGDPSVRDCLEHRLRGLLGADAEITGTDDGGLRAGHPDGRVVDASTGALVAGALARTDLEDLWASAG